MVFQVLADRGEFLCFAKTPGNEEAFGSRKPALVVVMAIRRAVTRDLVDQQFLEGAPFIVTGAVHRIDQGEDARLPRLIERAFVSRSCRSVPITCHQAFSPDETASVTHRVFTARDTTGHRSRAWPAGIVPADRPAYPRHLKKAIRRTTMDDTLSIPAPDGPIPAFLALPEGDEPAPAVIMLMDAPGIREELHRFARRVASAGFACVLPDMYYRLGTLRFDLSRRDDRMTAVFGAAMASLGHERVAADCRAILDALDADDRVAAGPRGLVGYCMSGQYVLAAACRFPERVAAVAAFHGVRMVTDEPDSPHLGAAAIRAEMFLGFASDDPLVPDNVIPTLRDAFTTHAVPHRIETYSGTRHGYSFPERDVYVEEAAEAGWKGMLDLFSRRLHSR